MHLILQPVSHPSLGEIVIRDRLFPVGRHEPPFDAYGAEVVAKLSRRHARIFMQDEAVYLVDLDSLNGTTVNGTPLDKQSRQLQQGDEIGFAGILSYRVRLESGDTADLQAGSDAILTLIPERLERVIEPIVVTEFPFLVSKSDELFTRYRERVPEQYEFLSRRHAHFFIKDHDLMVEDLGSTNGTFVSGRRLDEHARPLQDGDIIAFGGNDFVYRIHIKSLERKHDGTLDEASLMTEALHTDTDVTRTTFVTSANSFIDIFCADDEAVDAALPQDAAAAAASGKAQGRTQGEAGAVESASRNRFVIFLGELRRAFRDDSRPLDKRVLWGGLALCCLMAALIGLSYWQGADKRTIERLLDQGAYAESAARADAYLQRHPADQEVAEFALMALSRHHLPAWKRHLNAGEFARARAVIGRMREASRHHPDADAHLGLLEWITAQQAFMRRRGGSTAPIVLFRDEAEIARLIAWWDRDHTARQRLAARIVQYEPGFESIQAQSLSHLRALRSEKSLYLAAIEELKTGIRQRLEQNEWDGLHALLNQFGERYPRIAGVERLERDLHNYLELQRALEASAWLDAVALLDSTSFLTPLFRARVEVIRDRELPPADIAEAYQRAAALWRAGQGEAALERLRELSRGDWNELAERLLERRQSIWARYHRLVDEPDTPDYPQRLIRLYEDLKADQDAYFIQALRPAYETHREQLLQQAGQDMHKAARAWAAYQEHGRITGLQRLEARISPHYRDQAKRLGQALQKAEQATEAYRLLRIEAAAAQRSLYQAILQESRLQRRSLQELEMVLETSLFEGKIELLPTTD